MAVMFAGASVHAQSDQALKAAQLRFREGVALYKKADYEAARVAFAQAFAVLHSADVLLNLALAELNGGGHSLEALQHLRQYERDPKADSAVVKSKLPALIERAYKETGHLKVLDAPAGAAITIDGQPAITPLPELVDVSSGRHVLEARVQDKTLTAEVVAVAGEITPVKFGAVAATQAAPTTPAPTSSAPPVAPTATQPPPSGDAPPATPSESFWMTRRYVGVAVAGFGIIALATGGYFGMKSTDDGDRAKAAGANLGPTACANLTPPAGCADVKSAYDAQDRDHTLGVVFLGLGAAAVVTGAALILWPQSSPASRTAVVPVLSAHSGGLFLRGDF